LQKFCPERHLGDCSVGSSSRGDWSNFAKIKFMIICLDWKGPRPALPKVIHNASDDARIDHGDWIKILGPTESYYTGSPKEVTSIVICVTHIPVLLGFDVGIFKFWGLLQDIVPNAYVHDKLILINYRFLSSCSTSVRVLFLIVHFVAMEARTSKIYYRKSVQSRCCKVSGFAPVCRQQLHAHHRRIGRLILVLEISQQFPTNRMNEHWTLEQNRKKVLSLIEQQYFQSCCALKWSRCAVCCKICIASPPACCVVPWVSSFLQVARGGGEQFVPPNAIGTNNLPVGRWDWWLVRCAKMALLLGC